MRWETARCVLPETRQRGSSRLHCFRPECVPLDRRADANRIREILSRFDLKAQLFRFILFRIILFRKFNQLFQLAIQNLYMDVFVFYHAAMVDYVDCRPCSHIPI